MVLAMVRPYKHEKTGVYRLRKVVPEALRKAVGRREFKTTLGTKDPAEARRLAPPIMDRWESILAGARSGGATLTQRDVEALCGAWYRTEVEAHGDDPGDPEQWSIYLDHLGDRLEDVDPDWRDDMPRRVILKPLDRTEATTLLEGHGFFADEKSITRLGEALINAKVDFANEMRKRAEGDWSPDRTPDRFPTMAPKVPQEPPKATPKAAQKITFRELVDAWAAENDRAGKALYERQQTAQALSAFLGHDDPNRVSPEDVVNWKESRLKAGIKPRSVANDIGELQPIWKWGRTNRKIMIDNPFAGLAPKFKKQRGIRGPYTEAEAALLLTSARSLADTSMRWLPWLLCYSGVRIAEAAQSKKEDIRQTSSGVWFLEVHAREKDRSIKTEQSERQVPLHPALIAEGFLAYVQRLPAGSPLFPDFGPDRFGNRGGTATKRHSRWVRKTVGITDTKKDPAHAWRHLFEDRARSAGLQSAMTDGLMGHLNAQNESEGYGHGYGFMPDVTAPWVARMGELRALVGTSQPALVISPVSAPT